MPEHLAALVAFVGWAEWRRLTVSALVRPMAEAVDVDFWSRHRLPPLSQQQPPVPSPFGRVADDDGRRAVTATTESAARSASATSAGSELTRAHHASCCSTSGRSEVVTGHETDSAQADSDCPAGDIVFLYPDSFRDTDGDFTSAQSGNQSASASSYFFQDVRTIYSDALASCCGTPVERDMPSSRLSPRNQLYRVGLMLR